MADSMMRSSDSSIRVALLLSELLKRPLDYSEMRKLFNDKNKKSVSTNEALSKYLNTLRTLGLNIKREDKKYTLYNFLVQIVLTEDETSAFKNLETNVLKYGSKNEIQTFYEIKKRILRFLDAKSQNNISKLVEKYFTTPLGVKMQLFGKYCDERQTIKIKYNGIIHNIEPREVLFIEDKTYLEGYEPKTMLIVKFPLEKITFVKQLPTKSKSDMFTNSFVYEIYGRLKENYKLKDGERVLLYDDKKKVIKVENEDYEILARRLIRYKNNCKILKPARFEKYFRDFTNKILANYEEEIIK